MIGKTNSKSIIDSSSTELDNFETTVNGEKRASVTTVPTVLDIFTTKDILCTDNKLDVYLKPKSPSTKFKFDLPGATNQLYYGATKLLVPFESSFPERTVVQIPYTVISGNSQNSARNKLRVEVQSTNSECRSITVNGIPAEGPLYYTDDSGAVLDGSKPYYEVFVPACTDLSVSIEAVSHTATSSLMGDNYDDPIQIYPSGNDATYFTSYKGSHTYSGMGEFLEPDFPTVITAAVFSEGLEAGNNNEYIYAQGYDIEVYQKRLSI